MAGPTATFRADFTEWNKALEGARASMKTFEQSAKSLGPALDRSLKQFSGVEIKRQADIAALAVEKIGGAAKLTGQEQKKLSALVDEALEKYKALGQVAPQSLIQIRGELDKLADEAKRLKEGSDHLKNLGDKAKEGSPAISALQSAVKGFGAVAAGAFSIGAIANYIGSVVELGGKITDLSARTGIGVVAIQQLGVIAGDAGLTIDELSGLIEQMQKRLATSDGAAAAVKELGLNLEEVVQMRPDQQFVTLASAVAGIEDPLERARIGTELFGKQWASVSQIATTNMDEVVKKTYAMSAETVAILDGLGDKWGRFWNGLKVLSGEVLSRMVVPEALRVLTSQLPDPPTAKWKEFGEAAGTAATKLANDEKALAEVESQLAEGLKKTRSEVDQHAESIKRLRDQMSGAGLLKDLRDNLEAFRGLPQPIQDSRIAQDALVDAYIRALPALENASAAMLKQTQFAAGLAVSLGRLEPAIDNTGKALQNLGQQLSIDSFFGGMDSIGFESALVQPFQSLKTIGSDIPTSVLFPVQQKMSELAQTAIQDFTRMGTAIQGSFAQMLIGAKGFKDGFLDIWNSIKAGIARILTDILADFTNRFLKGLLAAMTGAQGGFRSAFAGLFGGGLFGGGGGGGFGLPGLGSIGLGGGGGFAAPIGANIAPGSMFSGLPGGAATTPWWQTPWGGGAIGVGAGMFVGGMVGSRTGNVAGGALSGAGTGAATGFAFGGPIGGLIGGIGGGLWGWYQAKQAQKRANDQRDTFLSQFGPGGTGEGSGFLNLASTLTKSTGEAGGGRLFQDLIKANDPEELRKAIAAVNAELEKYAQKTAEAKSQEDQQAAAIAKTKAELEEKTKAIRTQMQSLDDELAKLNASEAPEEHMGTVEKRTRERIAREKADLQRQLDAAQEAAAAAIQAINDAGAAGLNQLGMQGDETFDELKDGFIDLGTVASEQIDAARQKLIDLGKVDIPDIHVPVHYDYPPITVPNPGEPGPMSAGGPTPGFAGGTPGLGFVDFGKESLVRLHGREAVIPADMASRAARQWGGGSSGSSYGPTVVVLEVDGRALARAVIPTVPPEARRLGVRVRT